MRVEEGPVDGNLRFQQEESKECFSSRGIELNDP
jgi:hypothetical protein